MPCREDGVARWSLAIALGSALLACGPSEGPAPIAFDRTPCAHCGMLISDPRFAAQLRTEAWDVLSFDDPGCLLRWRLEHPQPPAAVWYHHVHEDRWLRESETAFVPVPDSPMGFEIGAVAAGSPGSFDAAEAYERVKRAQSRAGARR